MTLRHKGLQNRRHFAEIFKFLLIIGKTTRRVKMQKLYFFKYGHQIIKSVFLWMRKNVDIAIFFLYCMMMDQDENDHGSARKIQLSIKTT